MGIWTTRDEMRIPRYGFKCISVNKKIYCFNGTSDNGEHVSTEIFDAEKKIWSFGKARPQYLSRFGVAATEDSIFCIGGFKGAGMLNPETNVDIYDISTNTWRTGAPLPEGRAIFSCAQVGDCIYVVGGWGKIPDKLNPSYTDTLFIYNILADTWTQGTSLPEDSNLYSFAAAHGNKMQYFVNGKGYQYDPATDTWSKYGGVSLGSAMNMSSAAAEGNMIYFCGADSGYAIYSFDMNTEERATVARMPSLRHYMGCAVIDDKLYCIGGANTNKSPNEVYASMDVYDLRNEEQLARIELSFLDEMGFPVKPAFQDTAKIGEIYSQPYAELEIHTYVGYKVDGGTLQNGTTATIHGVATEGHTITFVYQKNACSPEPANGFEFQQFTRDVKVQYAVKPHLVEKSGLTIISGRFYPHVHLSEYYFTINPCPKIDLIMNALSIFRELTEPFKYELTFSDGSTENYVLTVERDYNCFRDGSRQLPYAITRHEDLSHLCEVKGKCFELLNDIQLPDSILPIGVINVRNAIYTTSEFENTFDGCNHTITFGNISLYSSNYALFHTIGTEGVVKNLKLANLRFTATAASQFVGGLAQNLYGVAQDVHLLDGELISSRTNISFAGLVGIMNWGGQLTRCTSNITISSTGDTSHGAGLVITLSWGTISECVTLGHISVNGANSYAGGVAARLMAAAAGSGTIRDCYNLADVYGRTYMGGLVGYVSGGGDIAVMENCYNAGTVSGFTEQLGYNGGLVGSVIGNSTNVTAEYFFKLKNSFNIGLQKQALHHGELIGVVLGKYAIYPVIFEDNMLLNDQLEPVGFYSDIYWSGSNLRAPALTKEVVFDTLQWDPAIWKWIPSLGRPVLINNLEDGIVDLNEADIRVSYLDDMGVSLQADDTTTATIGSPFSATAPAITGYTCIGHRIDSGAQNASTTASIADVQAAGHTITFYYEVDGGTDPGPNPGDDTCCAELHRRIAETLDQISLELRTFVCNCGGSGGRNIRLTNMLAYPDFSQTGGYDSWVQREGELLTVAGGIATVVGTQPDATVIRVAQSGFIYQSGHQYYTSVTLSTSDSAYNKKGVMLGNTGGTVLSSFVDNSSGWDRMSEIVDGGSVIGATCTLMFQWPTYTDISSKVFQFREPMLIDLTEAFGAGNEPDAQWCNDNISFFIDTLDITI